MVRGKTFIFDTCSLVYIYLHSRRSDAHTLLFQMKNALKMDCILAKNDLRKDLVNPLQTKFFSRIRILFSFIESPRDEYFEKIKEVALANNRITHQDVTARKLMDLDIVRLALHYQSEGKEVTVVSDDEGVHNLVKDLGKEGEIDVQYTHLFFLQLLPFAPDEETKLAIEQNVQDSFYYLNNYLKKNQRTLPYEKVISTSISVLSKVAFTGKFADEDLEQEINAFLDGGKRSKAITSILPLLEIIRKKRVDPDYQTESACLELMTALRAVINKEEIAPAVIELIHKELASYHLELAEQEHKDLNLVGALAHIRAAAQSIVFIKTEHETLQKNAEQLVFIEALLLLELGAQEEGLRYLEQFLATEQTTIADLQTYRAVAEALLIIFERKIGRIKEQSAEMLILLAKEALAIPNPSLSKKILAKMIDDERLATKYKKKAANELIHLANLRILMNDHPLIKKATGLLQIEIIDRTTEEPDLIHLQQIQQDFNCKIAKYYQGPWEIAEIREKKNRLWVYAWNERLKSFWVLDLPATLFLELENAKTITILSSAIKGFKKPMKNEDVKFRRRIVFHDQTLLAKNEKRALPLW